MNGIEYCNMFKTLPNHLRHEDHTYSANELLKVYQKDIEEYHEIMQDGKVVFALYYTT